MLKTIGVVAVVAFVGLMVSAASETIGIKLPFARGERLNQIGVEMKRIDFEEAAEGDRWRTVDDTVMGGVSQGSFEVTPAGAGVFSGELSLENSGGFSSVQRDIERGYFEEVNAIALRVKGDGRRYQFRLKMDRSNRTVSYRAEFDTRSGEWLTVSPAFAII